MQHAGFGNAGVGTDRIKIVVSAAQSATGATMNLGYTVSGTSSDGTVYPVRLPERRPANPTDCGAGSANRNFFSLLTTPSSWRCTNSSTWTACPPVHRRCQMAPYPSCPTGSEPPVGAPAGPIAAVPRRRLHPKQHPLRAAEEPALVCRQVCAPASSWDLQNNTTGAQIPMAIPKLF